MKIYEFKYHSGETDWIFAPNKKEAKEFYLNYSDCGDLDGYDIKAIPKKEWLSNYIFDTNESEPDSDEVEYNEDDYCCGYKIIESFSEYAERNTHTDIIATTEY